MNRVGDVRVSLTELEGVRGLDARVQARQHLFGLLQERGAAVLVEHGFEAAGAVRALNACAMLHAAGDAERWDLAMERTLAVRGFFSAGDLYTASDATPVIKRRYRSFELGIPTVGYEAAGSAQFVLGAPNVAPYNRAVGNTLFAYQRTVLQLGHRVARVLSDMLLREPAFLPNLARQPCSQLRALFYPPTTEVDSSELGLHTDYECFSLVTETAPGVLLSHAGAMEPLPADGGVVLLGGDLLEVLSNGLWPAAQHAVVPPTGGRSSLVFFYGLDYDVVVTPLDQYKELTGKRYPSVSVGEHLTGMAVRNFGHLLDAFEAGQLRLPFAVPDANPLKKIRLENAT